MNKILEINNLVKEYKDFTLGEISFSLEKGTILGIIGPNGSGKTTLIKTIMGMVIKKSGDISVFGQDADEYGAEIRDRIGFINYDDKIKEMMSPRSLGNTYGRFYSEWDSQKYQAYLDRFEINWSKRINKLSQGAQMKVFLAFALSHNAELLIFDEPTAGLDPIFREEILDIFLKEIEDSEKSIIISTHITSDLDKCADYLLVMNEGKKLLYGSKDEILDNHKLVKGDSAILSDENRSLFISIKNNKFGFEGLTKRATEVTKIMGKNYLIEKPRVEDIMVFYCKKQVKHV